jgi:hypothetical protein
MLSSLKAATAGVLFFGLLIEFDRDLIEVFGLDH